MLETPLRTRKQRESFISPGAAKDTWSSCGSGLQACRGQQQTHLRGQNDLLICETNVSEGEDAGEGLYLVFRNNSPHPEPRPPPHPSGTAHLSSRLSVISDTTAEELCHLRDYYQRQLRRIHYISHECLGQAPEPGPLACLSEPLRSLFLPCTVRQSTRSLWSRLSSRKKIF